jgi:hypothetical protein
MDGYDKLFVSIKIRGGIKMKRRRSKEYTYLIYCSLRKDEINNHCNVIQVHRKPILTDKDLKEITNDLEDQLNIDREKHNIIIHSYQLMH